MRYTLCLGNSSHHLSQNKAMDYRYKRLRPDNPFLTSYLLTTVVIWIGLFVLVFGISRDLPGVVYTGIGLMVLGVLLKIFGDWPFQSSRIRDLCLTLEPARVRPGETVEARLSFFVERDTGLTSVPIKLEAVQASEERDETGRQRFVQRLLHQEEKVVLELKTLPAGAPCELRTDFVVPSRAVEPGTRWTVTAKLQGYKLRHAVSEELEVA